MCTIVRHSRRIRRTMERPTIGEWAACFLRVLQEVLTLCALGNCKSLPSGREGTGPWISRALADAIVGSKQLGIGARLPRRNPRKGCRQPGVCRRADCELRARVEPGDSGARGSVRFELCAELVAACTARSCHLASSSPRIPKSSPFGEPQSQGPR